MAKKKHKSQPNRDKQKKHETTTRNAKSRREEIARRVYNHAAQSIREHNSDNPAFMGSMDYDARRIKRRIQAVVNSVEEICERVASICPDYPEFFTVEEDWIEANLHPLMSYDYIETRADTALGAAIWILDQIRDQGDIPEELDRLLDAIDNEADFYMPPIWDPCHSEQMLAGMLYVIQHRNDDCVGLDEKKYQKSEWDNLTSRVYMDPYTLENKHRQDVDSRNLYEDILDLVSDDAIQKAVQEYKEKWWDWVNRYYRSRAILAGREATILKKLDALTEKIGLRLEQMTVSGQQSESRTPHNHLLTVNKAMISQVNSNCTIPPVYAQHNLELQIMRWEEEGNALEAERREIYDLVTELWVSAGVIPSRTHESLVELYGQEVADIWAGFEIENPYQYCFAQLYLIDSGSDLPWLYLPGTSLMMASSGTLPWGILKYRMEPDGVWSHYDEATDEYVSGSRRIDLPKRIKLPEIENWYRMEYQNSEVDNSYCQQTYNLSQILYSVTGCIMPRNLERLYPGIPELDRFGIRGKKSLHPLIYCMSLLSEAKHQNQGSHYQPNLKWIPSEENDDKDDVLLLEEDDDPDALRQRISELEAEIKRLKTAAHDANKEVLAEKQKYAKLEVDRENDRQELADLRELVFNQQEDIYQTETTDEQIEFPYHTEQRIVVFGGHDSWAREIKPKLPNVRFIDRAMLPNADLIRNADVIWIQHNALGHMHFYKIINEARRYHIPVRYFSYASAAKCAEQLAKYDNEKS